jgi:hypothetical protein
MSRELTTITLARSCQLIGGKQVDEARMPLPSSSQHSVLARLGIEDPITVRYHCVKLDVLPQVLFR